MSKKIYFCGSIRGGRADEKTYQAMVLHMEELGHEVLTKHVAFPELSPFENDIEHRATNVYTQDTAWLRASDIVIAECSQASHGVGYELAYAEIHQKPTYVFAKKETSLTAMVLGNPYFIVYRYETVEEILEKIDEILK